jgi:broad specificity phosphatase PhoE
VTTRLPRLLAACLVALAAAASRAAAQEPTVVILVRHAEKARGGGDDPALTREGQARARALADALADTHVDAIITTQYHRTRDTAAPFAAARHLTLEVVDVRQGDVVGRIAQGVRRHAGQTVLVVAHAESVARIIAALGGPRLRDLCDAEYAHLFVLVLRRGREPALVHSRYGAPDRPSRDCR